MATFPSCGYIVAAHWSWLILYFSSLSSLLAPLSATLFCSAVTIHLIISLSPALSPVAEKYFSVSMTIKVGKHKVAWKGIFMCTRHPLDDCKLWGLLFFFFLYNGALFGYLPEQHISPVTSPSTPRDPLGGLCNLQTFPLLCSHFLNVLYLKPHREVSVNQSVILIDRKYLIYCVARGLILGDEHCKNIFGSAKPCPRALSLTQSWIEIKFP